MKTNILILLACFLSLQAMSQSQAETFIKEAQTYLAAKDYKNAQLSL